MSSACVVVLVLASIIAGVVNCDINDDIAAVFAKCNEEYKLTDDVIAHLRTPAYFPALSERDDVKCLVKCTGDHLPIYKADKSIDFDTFAKASAPLGKSDACIRSVYDSCTAITPFAKCCETAWALHVCLQTFNC